MIGNPGLAYSPDQNFRVVRRNHRLDPLDSRAASLPDIPGKNFHRVSAVICTFISETFILP